MADQQVLVKFLLRFEGTGLVGGVREESGQIRIVAWLRKVDIGQIVGEGLVELAGIEDGVVFCHVAEGGSLAERGIRVLLDGLFGDWFVEEDRGLEL